jgi:hypothetical protein
VASKILVCILSQDIIVPEEERTWANGVAVSGGVRPLSRS